MDKKPNIIFIMADDLGAWALGCSGNTEVKTPFIDKLASEGILFTNFFCTSPVCSPARASLLTGRIPSQHGIHDWLRAGDTIAKYEPEANGERIEYLQNQVGYTDELSKNGYECGISGKWHLGDSHTVQKGFHYWHVHAKGGSHYFNSPMIKEGEIYEEKRYITDVITQNGIDWLESRKLDSKPFYLSLHYTAPHRPWSRENHIAETFDYYYQNCPFLSTPNHISPPEWVSYLALEPKSENERKEWLSGYYASIETMDSNIGKVITWLEQNNLRDQTLIVFTSDNGMNMGHHGLYGKGNASYPLNMFEESIKVPFILSHPGTLPEKIENKDLISQYDFFPTILDYAGIENTHQHKLPGKSFYNQLLNHQQKNSQDHIIVFDEYGPVRMIRNEEWKYVYRFENGPEELYHLTEDPNETSNLINNNSHIHKQLELKTALLEWFSKYTESKVDGSIEKVTGQGQIGKCGISSKGKNAFTSNEKIDAIK